MERRIVILLFASLLSGPALASEPANKKVPNKPRSPLVVHEWGTFTTIAGKQGGSLEWRPLSGHSDLPSFVYKRTERRKGLRFRARNVKKMMRGTVRMETPVIYFYTSEEREVRVRVKFPGGKITEWYPRANRVGTGVDWGRFKLLPHTKVPLLREPTYNHYYPARETDATPLRVCGDKQPRYEYEKFLFYRGVGTLRLPISAKLAGDSVQVENTGLEPVRGLIRFERTGDRVSFTIPGSLPAKQSMVLRKGGKQSLALLKTILTKVLVTRGLYRKEAQAMIKTWEDHWFTEGLRLFYVVPRAVTDRILPLHITPRPDALVRVLIGRIELITPAREQRIKELALELASPVPATRAKARQGLKAFGRFAEPTLRQVLATLKGARVRARIEAYLKN